MKTRKLTFGQLREFIEQEIQKEMNAIGIGGAAGIPSGAISGAAMTPANAEKFWGNPKTVTGKEKNKEVLEEAMQTELPNEAKVYVYKKNGDQYQVMIVGPDATGKKLAGKAMPKAIKVQATKDFGTDKLKTWGDLSIEKSYESGCEDQWEVLNSAAESGYGPMLYDIALELAGKSGIIPDRQKVSPAAQAVWKFYYDNRKDVTKTAVDYECDSTQKNKIPELDFVYRKLNRDTINRLYDTDSIVFIRGGMG